MLFPKTAGFPYDKVVVDRYLGPVVRVGDFCYLFNDTTLDPATHPSVDQLFQDCEDCHMNWLYVECYPGSSGSLESEGEGTGGGEQGGSGSGESLDNAEVESEQSL